MRQRRLRRRRRPRDDDGGDARRRRRKRRRVRSRSINGWAWMRKRGGGTEMWTNDLRRRRLRLRRLP